MGQLMQAEESKPHGAVKGRYHVKYEANGPGFIDARGVHYKVGQSGQLLRQDKRLSKKARRRQEARERAEKL